MRVTTPNAKLLLIRSGVFRIDVMANGGAAIEVTDGEALLGDRNATLLRQGFAAKLSGRDVTVEKFNRKDLDQFEAWSKSRSRDLAKQSAKLRDAALRDSLLSSFNGGQWGMYNSFGLWVFNPMYGGYCFLPFSAHGTCRTVSITRPMEVAAAVAAGLRFLRPRPSYRWGIGRQLRLL